MKQLLSKKRGIVLAAALALLLVPGVAFARDGSDDQAEMSTQVGTTTEMEHETTVKTEQEDASDDSNHQSGKDKIEAAKERVSGRLATAKARLEAAQLKRCEAKEKAITNIMARIGDRGQKQLDLFTTIAERVENFYTEKGKTLDNYDALVAEVNTKKAAAQTVVNGIQAADTSFKCDGDNPHGVVDGFKDSLKQEISALKEYRTAVKNLIVGVKSVQSTEATESTDEGAQQ